MLRASVVAILLLAAPVYAQEVPDIDAALMQLMNADGDEDYIDYGEAADDDTGTPDVGGAPSAPVTQPRQEDLDLQASCGGSFDSDLDEADPCSGWFVVDEVCWGDDPGTECEPAYFNCEMAISGGMPCAAVTEEKSERHAHAARSGKHEPD